MRIKFIDFLRFVAAFSVLYQHVVESSELDFLRPSLQFSPGVFGVVVFFFVSGFVIPFSVKKWNGIVDFGLRRVFRIFPAYYFTLFLLVLLASLGIGSESRNILDFSAYEWSANLFLIQDYVGSRAALGVSWTLSVEFAWYGLFVLHFIVFGFRRVFELSLLFFMSFLVVSLLSVAIEQRVPFGRLGMVYSAVMGYLSFQFIEGRIASRYFNTAVFAYIIAIIVSQFVSFGLFEHPNISLFNGLCGFLCAALIFFPFIYSQKLRENRIVENKFMQVGGEISYSIYLVHAVLLTAHLSVLGSQFVWLVVPAGTFLTSFAMFHFVERPGIKFGKLVSRWGRSRVSAV